MSEDEFVVLGVGQLIGRKGVEDFINITNKMITDREFYKEGLRISEDLPGQFDMEVIRRKLMTLYADLIKNSQPAVSPTLFPKEISWGVS